MEKWREMTSIEDYNFDPDGKYDGSLGKEEWEEIFNDLYQRAETTEEYLENQWIDPVSTRNAYTYRINKNGEEYIVLKYYDGMYALYEIKDDPDVNENVLRTRQVIAKLDEGVSVRAAILEAVNGQKRLFEDVAGMEKEDYDKFLAQVDKWTGGSGSGGWVYDTSVTNGGNTYTLILKKNPIADLRTNVSLDVNNNVLNGEIYHDASGDYMAASGPVSFTGLKSVLRDLLSQVEMANADLEASGEDENIYGY